MDAYPSDYHSHNIPFLVVCGLASDEGADADASRADTVSATPPLSLQHGGPQIASDLPPLTSATARQLRSYLEKVARGGASHEGKVDGGGRATQAFSLKVVGREYPLPARKADPPSHSPGLASATENVTQAEAGLLHSPISPLSPGSPVFPDGVMTPLWIMKHQSQLPSALVFVYTLTADPNLSSLHDNQIKNDINQIKKVLAESSYKSRCVVILLGEKSVLDAPEVDDRLANIRRATGLDPKTSFFFLPPSSSPVEIEAFAKTVLSTLRPLCVEYYRDLSKHARRKRNRGTIPPPTSPPTSGTSQTLSSQGWAVRYEFKLGVLAEFRQEMDAACRNYESAYDTLMGQDVFEAVASWSPRWNDRRLLADVIAIRILRCLLWSSQTTSAARRWGDHRKRLLDIVDRRGKGSTNYGWQAWESRWARIMAELIQEANLPLARRSGAEGEEFRIYATPEKAIPVGERVRPWELLHHPGYWMNLSTAHLHRRKALALEIPEEDRLPPGQSPASQVASASHHYDTYLCPEPHIEFPLSGSRGTDHSELIIRSLQETIHDFRRNAQGRVVDRLKLELAREEMRKQDWVAASKVLRPLWQNMTWRREGWWNLVEQVCWALRECARQIGDGGSIIGVEWELLSDYFTPKPASSYDLSECLQGLDNVRSKPAVVLRAGEIVSFLSASYAFKFPEGHVGEPLASQLVVHSTAHKHAASVSLSEVRIGYEGNLKTVILRHKPSTGVEDAIAPDVDLREVPTSQLSPSPGSPSMNSRVYLVGDVDLTITPGQTRIIGFSIILREAGDAKASVATLTISDDLFDVDYVIPFADQHDNAYWWSQHNSTTKKQWIGRDDAAAVKVLPKPPKMQLRLLDLHPQYYTNEKISMQIKVTNEETEETEASMELRIFGSSEDLPRIMWESDSSSPREPKAGENSENDLRGEPLPGQSVGVLEPGATTIKPFSISPTTFPIDFIVEVKILYHLLSDLETPISKTLSVDVPVVGPFEANYDFSPRVHHAKWPSYFNVDDVLIPKNDEDQPSDAVGLVQRWCLTSKIVSFASESLLLEKVTLISLGVIGGVRCSIVDQDEKEGNASELAPDGLREVVSVLDVDKMSLEDRRSASLDLALEIQWRRGGDSGSTTSITSLTVPRLLIPGGEPRILASCVYSDLTPGLIHLDYTLENPSMHLLTFNVSLDSSEEFAFSGPKFGTLQLVPLSRHTLRFNIYPLVSGTWIQPRLKVVDRYFNKTLRISATEGMKGDKKGILVWVNAEV
ncbi:MAG: hypothetical protein M1833_007160 [Piccolia ochrophora]|nr:MAG: hypothetical protein M1833_007160 [Piccolia ochrophora]